MRAKFYDLFSFSLAWSHIWKLLGTPNLHLMKEDHFSKSMTLPPTGS
jgi:hypothetical protein